MFPKKDPCADEHGRLEEARQRHRSTSICVYNVIKIAYDRRRRRTTASSIVTEGGVRVAPGVPWGSNPLNHLNGFGCSGFQFGQLLIPDAGRINGPGKGNGSDSYTNCFGTSGNGLFQRRQNRRFRCRSHDDSPIFENAPNYWVG
jgi:hypothetical protein